MNVGTFMNKNKTGFGNECSNAWWEEKVLVPIIESQSNQAFHKLDILTLSTSY